MEAPQIEVTVMNPSEEPALYSELCERDSDQWPQVLYDGGHYLEDQVFRQLGNNALDSRGDACSSQRRSLSRRAERGPGKSPSPSRNSPRRHSPAPYSPKRQHRPRSPVTLDDYYDVTLSPGSHSPVPRFVDGSLAQSLTSEEFTCVSYSDPFSSSSTFRSSESVQAHSGQMDSGQLEGMVSKDLRNTEATADMNGQIPWLDTNCLSPEDPCLEDTLALLEEGDFPGAPGMADLAVQDGDLFLYEVDEERLPSKDRRYLTRADSGHFLAANCRHPASFYNTEVMSQNFREGMHSMKNGTEASCQRIENLAQVDQVSVLENRERFLAILDACTDSSNEEKIEEEMMALQRAAVGSFSLPRLCDRTDLPRGSDLNQMNSTSLTLSDSTTMLPAEPHTAAYEDPASRAVHPSEAPSVHLCGEQRQLPCQRDAALGRTDCFSLTGASVKDPGFHCSATRGRGMEEPSMEDPSWCSLEDSKSRPHDSVAPSKVSAEMESESSPDADLGEYNGSTDLSILQHFSNEYNSSSGIFPDDMAVFSLYSPSPGECPSSASAGTDLHTSPTTSPGQPVGKTPEDFSLPRLVGSPPLQFPHCSNVVLIHDAHSNPYNPDLPTPPIVLTDHGSYYVLGASPAFAIEPRVYEEPVPFQSAPTSFDNYGGHERTPEGINHRGDVSKSRSCPSLLHQTGGSQAWAVGGHSHPLQDTNNVSAFYQEEGSCRFRNSFRSAAYNPFSSSSSGCNTNSTTCFGAPASQCNSRAAVIDRLRKVVEKRLSASLESLESRVYHG